MKDDEIGDLLFVILSQTFLDHFISKLKRLKTSYFIKLNYNKKWSHVIFKITYEEMNLIGIQSKI